MQVVNYIVDFSEGNQKKFSLLFRQRIQEKKRTVKVGN